MAGEDLVEERYITFHQMRAFKLLGGRSG